MMKKNYLKKALIAAGILFSLSSTISMAYMPYNPWIPPHRGPNGAWFPGHFRCGPRPRFCRPGCEFVPAHRLPNGAFVRGHYAGPSCPRWY